VNWSSSATSPDIETAGSGAKHSRGQTAKTLLFAEAGLAPARASILTAYAHPVRLGALRVYGLGQSLAIGMSTKAVALARRNAVGRGKQSSVGSSRTLRLAERRRRVRQLTFVQDPQEARCAPLPESIDV
jgi:hypothetical protein